MKNVIPLLLAILFLYACTPPQEQQETIQNDPLPSWNEGNTKQAIINYVMEVTNQESENFIPVSDRIATFDNDGTLWSEQPYYFQFQFAFDRVKEMAVDHPEWNDNPLFKAAIENDMQTVMKSGMKGLMEIIMTTHAGMTTEEFEQVVKEWINTATHPKTNKLYKEMIFQPMLELLDYLRANGFKIYIVSGGGIEFMRPWTEEVYGIPPEQVIGSSIKAKFELREGTPVLVKLPELDFFDDKEGKPVAINKFIGKRPIAAFGNSDGDLQMMQWTASNNYRSFILYLHHTDGEREWAYDRESHIGGLNKGLDEANEKGWTVADMKTDWRYIYPFDLLDEN